MPPELPNNVIPIRSDINIIENNTPQKPPLDIFNTARISILTVAWLITASVAISGNKTPEQTNGTADSIVAFAGKETWSPSSYKSIEEVRETIRMKSNNNIIVIGALLKEQDYRIMNKKEGSIVLEKFIKQLQSDQQKIETFSFSLQQGIIWGDMNTVRSLINAFLTTVMTDKQFNETLMQLEQERIAMGYTSMGNTGNPLVDANFQSFYE